MKRYPNTLAFLFLLGSFFLFVFILLNFTLEKTALGKAQDPWNINKETVTFTDGATDKTQEFNLEDRCLVGIHLGTITTSDITAECADASAGTFKDVKTNGSTALTLVTSAESDSAYDLTVSGNTLCGFIWCKLEFETDQGTDRNAVLFYAR